MEWDPGRKRAAGAQKEAAGGYRSRGVEGVLVERELRGRRQKEAAGGYRSRGVEAVLVEIELRGSGGGLGEAEGSSRRLQKSK